MSRALEVSRAVSSAAETVVRAVQGRNPLPLSPAPVVRVNRLSHWFGEGSAKSQVLFDLSLEIPAGKVVILTGPSGAGKTTLLTLIGALRSIQAGSVWVLGRELTAMNAEELAEIRTEIGFIFQGHNLFASLTALQTVLMALELKQHESRELKHGRAADILTLLGLAESLGQKTNTLSGGQKQRVAVARALANRPRLILADEPTAALDPQSGREVVSYLQKLSHEDGCSCLLVSHDTRIFDVADRIIHMVAGQIASDVSVRKSVAGCDLLGNYPGFLSLSPEALALVASRLVEEQHPAGAILFRQGDVGDKFYLLRKGVIDVFQGVPGQGAVPGPPVSTLRAGEWFGETSLVTGKPRSATASVREEAILSALGKADFHAALETRRRDGL